MFKQLRCASPLLLMGALFSLSIPLAAFAAQVLSPPVTATGASTTPILNAANNGSGSAINARSRGNTIVATSEHQNGVVGLTHFSGSNAINNGAGVIGFDGTSSVHNQGVSGESVNGTGVFALSTTTNHSPPGQAINAIANAGRGIVSTVNGAFTDCGLPAISAFSPYASVTLADSSPDLCGGIAPIGLSVGLTATVIPGETGIVAFQQGGGAGPPGVAVGGVGDGGAAFVANGSVSGTGPQPEALYLQQNGAGLVLYALGTNGGLSLDNHGNLVISGKLTQHGTPGAATTEGDASLNRPLLAANLNAATIEDVGEGRLVSGQGYVRIDSGLSRKIDFSQPYQVVITPEGPSAGVYVSEKTSQGFVVRENPGGHSTLPFSYRLVAAARALPQHQKLKRLDIRNMDRVIARLKASAQYYRKRAVPKLSL
ncbi:MAG: hypothetical protein M3160_10140 [Candidatus Eremiobacteraeota bacterium]|nr:hypothetical protein [Candidatus Eremiobacteraeota bacterium]